MGDRGAGRGVLSGMADRRRWPRGDTRIKLIADRMLAHGKPSLLESDFIF
jgi:hypothetical protein